MLSTFLLYKNVRATYIINCKMSYRPSEQKLKPQSAIFFTTDRKQFDRDDVLSTGSYYSSQFTKSSGFSSTISTLRINEIQPKKKIIVTKTPSLQSSKMRQHDANSKKKNTTEKTSIQWSTLIQKQHQPKLTQTESMSYNILKPIFNFNKIQFLCGMQNKLGENGCLCKDPCKWKTSWTKNYSHQDFLTFKKLLDIPATKENALQIEKDLARTHPQCPTFSKNKHYRQMLREILLAYSVYDISIGYVQGLNMIAGALLYHIKNSQQSFWALVQMMEYQQLRMIYLDGFVHLKQHCKNIEQLLKNKVNDLFTRMNELQISSDCFLNGWILSLMGTCIPLEYTHEVIDKFRDKGWKYFYKLVITYLLFLKEYLMMADDQAEFLSNLNTQSSRDLGVEWKDMIHNAENLKI